VQELRPVASTEGITLQVEHRNVMRLIGSSGSGKSRFLRCINHLDQVNAGRLYVDGELVGDEERGKQAARTASGGPRRNGAISAWSSNGSICSRT
jgi:ABC-type polar amino acid transport system ATPase subunit